MSFAQITGYSNTDMFSSDILQSKMEVLAYLVEQTHALPKSNSSHLWKRVIPKKVASLLAPDLCWFWSHLNCAPNLEGFSEGFLPTLDGFFPPPKRPWEFRVSSLGFLCLGPELRPTDATTCQHGDQRAQRGAEVPGTGVDLSLVWWVENWQKCNMEVAKSFQKWHQFRFQNEFCWISHIYGKRGFQCLIFQFLGSFPFMTFKIQSPLWPQGPDAIHRMSLWICRAIWSVFKACRLNWNNNWVCLGETEWVYLWSLCLFCAGWFWAGNFWCISGAFFSVRT